MKSVIIQVLFLSQVLGEHLPHVCVDQGACYNGSWLSGGKSNTTYAAFQGIKYAQAPIGNLRFRPPVPFVPEENEVFDVSKESKIACIQIPGGKDEGQEDCLLLNVYVPKDIMEDPETKGAVMFFIHGGGFGTGSGIYSEYGPQHFMDRGVIMVMINYRLGPFGFLTLGNEVVPGNAGFRDQGLAMQWVQDNIANFGGDPGSVTIFGESAGGFSVASHILSPMSENLFQKAIIQSGAPFNPSWSAIVPENGLKWHQEFIEKLGCGEEVDSLECLENVEADKINDIGLNMTYTIGASVWSLMPDMDFTQTPFMPGNPETLLSDGQFNKDVKVIIGFNKDEGVLWFAGQVAGLTSWDDYKNTFDTIGTKVLFEIPGNDIPQDFVDKAHKILEGYIGSIDNVNEEHAQDLIYMGTDGRFTYGASKTIDYLVQQGVDVFPYLLSYQGEFTILNVMNGLNVNDTGVAHGDDLFYLWDPFFEWEFGFTGQLSGEDLLVRDTMMAAWTNFAKFGDPTPPESGLPTWTPQSTNSDHYYWDICGPTPKLTSEADLFNLKGRLAVWDKVLNS